MRLARALMFGATAIALVALPGSLSAQATSAPEGGDLYLSRDALQDRLAEFERIAASSSYPSDERSRARAETDLLRERLANGDFKVGDQIALRVEGEDSLSQTFTVSRGPALDLPAIGTISLEGVLRSELESHLQRELARYIRDPQVRARALFRITITGGVGQPGFYVVPSEALLTDALMSAGGPAPGARLREIRVERDGKVIWGGEALQRAITEGRTLDQLSLQAGDHVVVPEPRGGPPMWTYIATGVSALAAIASLVRVM